jgi:hypothetical protein
MNQPSAPGAAHIFTDFRRVCQEFASGLLPNPMQGIDLHRIEIATKSLKHKGKIGCGERI